MELTNQNSYLKEHVLKCPICYESFSNIHKPLIIPCGHTICSLCVENLKKIASKDYEEDYASEIIEEEFDLSLNSENEEEDYEQIERSEEDGSEERSEEEGSVGRSEEEGSEETSENEESGEESEDNNANEIVVENINAPEIIFENITNTNREGVKGNIGSASEAQLKENIASSKKKIKIKCSNCRKRMKIFESEILLNLNVLKIIDHINAKEDLLSIKEIHQNGIIGLDEKMEKSQRKDITVFCKLCRFVDCHDSHLAREGSRNHKEYLIYLDEEAFAKLRNLYLNLNSNFIENKENNFNSSGDCEIEEKIFTKEKTNNQSTPLSHFENIFFSGVNDEINSALRLFFENLIQSKEFENFGPYIKNYFMINSSVGRLKNKSFFKLTKLYENFQQITDELEKQEEAPIEKKLLQKANNCIDAGEILCDKYAKALKQCLANFEKLGIANSRIDEEFDKNLQIPLNSYSKLLDRVIQIKMQKLIGEEFLGSYWNNLLGNERRYTVYKEDESDKILLYDLRIKTELEIFYEKIFKDLKNGGTLSEEELVRNYTDSVEVDEDGRYLFLIGKRLSTSKSFRVYDLLLRQLENKKKIPLKFYAADKYYFKKRLFILGGITEVEHYTNNCYYYDVEADWWGQLPALNIARGNKSINAHENKLYVFGGSSDTDNEHLLTFELLDLNRMGRDENNFKWEAFKIKDFNTPIQSMLHGFISKNYLVIFGGEEPYYNDQNRNGYLIHMSDDEGERRLVENFKIRKASATNRNSCSNLRGFIAGFSFYSGHFSEFNVRNNLIKLKNTII